MKALQEKGYSKCRKRLYKNRIGIDKRQEIVNLKTRFGNLEADTIIGNNHQRAIVTLNDRASGVLKMKRTTTREAQEISDTINTLLEDWIPYIKTIISDNGKEFALHELVCETSKITDQQISDVENKLNNRPRKRFNFDTPLEKMEQLLFNQEAAFIG